MDYIEVNLEVSKEGADILIAELAEIGFFTFEEHEHGLKGYINYQDFEKSQLNEIVDKYASLFPASYTISEIEKKNWNEEWEKNFTPIEIKDKCRVRASFHPYDPNYPIDVVINPKMSFGTGHHSTTSLMMEFQLELKHEGKHVADIGCGTGILAIMATKLGAEAVFAVDIEDWSVENAKENATINGCSNIKVSQGKWEINNSEQKYNIILANINKNVLLEELPLYVKSLSPNAKILLSGFYEEDIHDIERKAVESGLIKESQKIKNHWAAVLFKNQ